MTLAQQHVVPSWFPAWAAELSERYFSGSTSLFVLHGNVHDLLPLTADGSAYGGLADFLTEQVFGRWDLVLDIETDDIATLSNVVVRGIRAAPGVLSTESLVTTAI